MKKTQTINQPKMKIGYAELYVKDLNGVKYPIEGAQRNLSNVIYTNTKSKIVRDLSKDLHLGKTIEVQAIEIDEILNILSNSEIYPPWVMEQIIEYHQEIKQDFLIKTQNNGKETAAQNS